MYSFAISGIENSSQKVFHIEYDTVEFDPPLAYVGGTISTELSPIR